MIHRHISTSSISSRQLRLLSSSKCSLINLDPCQPQGIENPQFSHDFYHFPGSSLHVCSITSIFLAINSAQFIYETHLLLGFCKLWWNLLITQERIQERGHFLLGMISCYPPGSVPFLLPLLPPLLSFCTPCLPSPIPSLFLVSMEGGGV